MSGDLISRQAALKQITANDTSIIPYARAREYVDELKNYVIKIIETLPSAEPEVKHGKWIYDTKRVMRDGWINSQYHCSECGEQDFTLYNFCPNCGADMRGVNAKA